MKIDRETVKKIAHLARLEHDPETEEAMMASMTEILDWVEKLEEVDTEGVEPLMHMSYELNVMRDDQVKDHLDRSNALDIAPHHDQQFFRVPKVLDSGQVKVDKG
ncbi:Asp-tRNA(Asn)/Glu-tRNA(Gln) amidotransferase subunit GatC [Tunicatimonas pelagia]|uniref:Asp-tRNA(Asn)/Glu-tRNA(Gln) amidotransferase subunit GatC n=1 Tax=Tunicatimonas pelagia TaxID=931531 RepID=UPI0026665972|nr:Asp-tRNA(Asn)/Glu-tRNA(Gln) amidotransferase subunit GatC [Tunicatimonas pelagia]WKN43129.1 Asp-tRNA(Asn)/Glu-tRNA(Gln) amidotransferase subunit GatC [Tunicatimonas pelagia]